MPQKEKHGAWDYRHCKTFRTVCFHFAFKVILRPSQDKNETKRKTTKWRPLYAPTWSVLFAVVLFFMAPTTVVLPDDVDCRLQRGGAT
jgi:hypothetical protein